MNARPKHPKIPINVGMGSTKLVDRARLSQLGGQTGDCLGDILDKSRLQSRITPSEQRKHRQHASRRRAVRRPRKPVPPNTVIVSEACPIRHPFGALNFAVFRFHARATTVDGTTY